MKSFPLIGARHVASFEPTDAERSASQQIKALTSGEPMEVKNLHSDFVTSPASKDKS